MIWYSVKKYMPPWRVPMVVRGWSPEGEFIAIAFFDEEDHAWYGVNSQEEMKDISHFLNLPPLEIEESEARERMSEADKIRKDMHKKSAQLCRNQQSDTYKLYCLWADVMKKNPSPENALKEILESPNLELYREIVERVIKELGLTDEVLNKLYE